MLDIDFATFNYNIDFADIVSQSAAGLGASALAKSSHAIFSNFDITLSHNTSFASDHRRLAVHGLDNLSGSTSKGGIPRNVLLNVLVGGFVDSLKNPFIYYANITRQTLNATIYAIRSGYGLATFALMQQPAAKALSYYDSLEEAAKVLWAAYVAGEQAEVEEAEAEEVEDVEEVEESDSILEEDIEESEDTEDTEETNDTDNKLPSGKTLSYQEIMKKVYDIFPIFELSDKTLDVEPTQEYLNLLSYDFLNILANRFNDRLIHGEYGAEASELSGSEAIQQLVILDFIATLKHAGDQLSTATRFHNIYSNENMASFPNVIEYLTTVADKLPGIEKYFSGYSKLISNDFIFGQQIDLAKQFIDELGKMGDVRLLPLAFEVYGEIAKILPNTLTVTKRREVFTAVVRALDLYFKAQFAIRVLHSSGREQLDLIYNIARNVEEIKKHMVKHRVNLGATLLSSLYPVDIKGKMLVKFNNMNGKETGTKNILYNDWLELFEYEEHGKFPFRQVAIDLYLYSVFVGKFSTGGTHDLFTYTPMKVFNAVSYMQDGVVKTIHDFYDEIKDRHADDYNGLLDFIISYAAHSTEIVPTVGKRSGKRNGYKIVPTSPDGFLKMGFTFYAPGFNSIPLVIATKKKALSSVPNVKIKLGSGNMLYKTIATIVTEPKDKSSKPKHYYIYAADMQPAIFSANPGSGRGAAIDFLNIGKDMYNFQTRNPYSIEDLVKKMRQQIPDANNPEFTTTENINELYEVPENFVSEKHKKRAEETRDIQAFFDERSSMLEPDNSLSVYRYKPDASEGNEVGAFMTERIAALAESRGKDPENVVIAIRPSNHFGRDLNDTQIAMVQSQISQEKYIITNILDNHVTSTVNYYTHPSRIGDYLSKEAKERRKNEATQRRADKIAADAAANGMMPEAVNSRTGEFRTFKYDYTPNAKIIKQALVKQMKEGKNVQEIYPYNLETLEEASADKVLDFVRMSNASDVAAGKAEPQYVDDVVFRQKVITLLNC
jgi:hypothetical protein